MNYPQLMSALLIACGLFYVHFRTVDLARTHARAQGYQEGLAESNQRLYSKGHEDGVYEGRIRAQLEQDTREVKALMNYEEGYQDALNDMRALNDSAMIAATQDTIRLSA